MASELVNVKSRCNDVMGLDSWSWWCFCGFQLRPNRTSDGRLFCDRSERVVWCKDCVSFFIAIFLLLLFLQLLMLLLCLVVIMVGCCFCGSLQSCLVLLSCWLPSFCCDIPVIAVFIIAVVGWWWWWGRWWCWLSPWLCACCLGDDHLMAGCPFVLLSWSSFACQLGWFLLSLVSWLSSGGCPCRCRPRNQRSNNQAQLGRVSESSSSLAFAISR